jgi:putative ABC transport system permease protein
MQDLLQDLRYGFRLLFRDSAPTAVVVLSLALGIGANATIFSFFNAMFLHTLPVAEPGRLVHVYTTDAKNTGQFMNYMQLSYPNFEDYRNLNQAFSGLVAQTFTKLSLTTRGAPELVRAAVVTGNYFDVLGVKAAAGRTFQVFEDLAEGKYSAVVLSDRMWKRQFGADRGMIGKEIVAPREILRHWWELSDNRYRHWTRIYPSSM